MRVFHYPYTPKVKQKGIAQHNENEQSLFNPGKGRYGVVVGGGNRGILTIPVIQIMSHQGEVEKEGYELRDDEIFAPTHLHFYRNGSKQYLKGVIKAERIEFFEADEISAPLTRIPLRVKMDLVERYEAILKNPYYFHKLNEESPKHQSVMRQFKESVIAERLNFLVTESGENKYDVMRKSPLFVDEIQHVGSHNRLDIYALKLQGRRDSFSYSIATTKSVKEIKQDWNDIKPAVYWLKQDQKFWALSKNIDQRIVPDPLPHPDNYVSLGKLNSKQLAKDRKLENEYGK